MWRATSSEPFGHSAFHGFKEQDWRTAIIARRDGRWQAAGGREICIPDPFAPSRLTVYHESRPFDSIPQDIQEPC
jgi:hypothetical protein